ncbi:starry night, partial [Carabus blaptoides fortunei]
FLKPGIEISRLVKASSMICFPKYNNYLKDEAKFDSNSKFLVPLNLLGIKPLDIGEMTTKHSLSNSGAIISYAQYSQAGICDRRSMTNLCCDGSPVISVSILEPEYVEAVTKPSVNFEQRPRKVMKKTFSNSADIKLENSAYLREETLSRRRRDEYELSKKLIKGEWSRVGCRTELDENWTDKVPLMINCTCNHLSSFDILVDVIDLEFVLEPSPVEDVYSYSCFFVSLPLLLSTGSYYY